MAAYLVPVLEALTTAVGTVWPETIPGGIYSTVQAAHLTLDLKVQNGGLPFAVIELPLAPADWGADNEAYEPLCSLYRVTDDGEALDTLVGKLEALRDWLTANPLAVAGETVAQVFGDPAPVWGMELGLNDYFLRTQRPFVCGAVLVELIVGQRHQ